MNLEDESRVEAAVNNIIAFSTLSDEGKSDLEDLRTEDPELAEALEGLYADGLVKEEGGRYTLTDAGLTAFILFTSLKEDGQ